MSDGAFTKKRLSLTITLGTGTFGEELSNTITLSKIRAMADLNYPAGDSMGELRLRVYGLKQETMNQLTTIGFIQNGIKGKNSILLAAGDDESGMRSVFTGTIYDAWADYSSAPDVAFMVVANAGLGALVKPVDASSYKGATAVDTIMSELAGKMGVAYQNDGVDVQLSNPYFPGTALMQMRQCARAADINATVEMDTLYIWPKSGSRKGTVPLISPRTGMVGYPMLNSAGMAVRTRFNGDLRPGGDVTIESSIPMACGSWRVGPLTHALSSEIPGGPWFTNFQCSHGEA